jgi:hypothetical protein
MTVPRHFRRNSEIPDILVLHYADLPENDVETARGFEFTCAQRTILDLLEALRQGLEGGLITPQQIQTACASVPARNQILRAV